MKAKRKKKTATPRHSNEYVSRSRHGLTLSHAGVPPRRRPGVGQPVADVRRAARPRPGAPRGARGPPAATTTTCSPGTRTCCAAAVDTATFSSAQGLTVEYGELEKIGLADNPPMVMLDPPEHTAFRKLVSRGFTPRAVREVEPAGPRVRRRTRLERVRRGRAAATSWSTCSSRCRAWWWPTTSAYRPRTATSSTRWTDAIVAAELGGRSHRRPPTRRSARCSATSPS